jgi:hypothetical protein
MTTEQDTFTHYEIEIYENENSYGHTWGVAINGEVVIKFNNDGERSNMSFQIADLERALSLFKKLEKNNPVKGEIEMHLFERTTKNLRSFYASGVRP